VTTPPLAFNARLIDRFMRLPRAEYILAAVAFGLNAAVLLTHGGSHGTWSDFQHVVGTRWKFILAFSTIFAVGGWWTAHTWRQLWRTGRSRWERVVYDSGIRGFGFATGVSLIAIVTWLGWTADSGPLFGPMMLTGLLAGLFFGVPVALHMGYFWGTAFAVRTGVEHDPRVEVGKPPKLP
jgi:hypothetical protein